jgi:hypothetical protein
VARAAVSSAAVPVVPRKVRRVVLVFVPLVIARAILGSQVLLTRGAKQKSRCTRPADPSWSSGR